VYQQLVKESTSKLCSPFLSPIVQLYEVTAEMNELGENDLHPFLEMARNTEYCSLFYILLFTGLRRVEALALRWQDTDLLLCQLSITRGMEDLSLAKTPVSDKISFKEPKTQKSRRSIVLFHTG
jgi:integrase